jgi:hypothetical protein
MDLLRIQDNVTCQAVVQVREKSTRAYVVKRQILEWKSGESYKSYNPATNKLAISISADNTQRTRRPSMRKDCPTCGESRSIALTAGTADPIRTGARKFLLHCAI